MLHTVHLSDPLLAHTVILPWSQITKFILHGDGTGVGKPNEVLRHLFWSTSMPTP
jgi:hypothetical protein